MTPRKPMPIHCPACASELAPAFIRKAANTLAASAPRPGSTGNTRNPYGRAGKPKDEDEILSPAEEDIREEVRRRERIRKRQGYEE